MKLYFQRQAPQIQQAARKVHTMMKHIATRASRLVNKSLINSKASVPSLTKSFTTFAERERGEEAKYVRKQEELFKEEMRKKLEAALALPEHHEDRKEIVDALR